MYIAVILENFSQAQEDVQQVTKRMKIRLHQILFFRV